MNFSPNMVFLNRSFDKKRLKALLLWFRLNLSEGAALEAVEILQGLGFRSATQGAISLGLDDLKTPTSKNGRVFQAQLEVALAHHEHHRGNRTPVELFQHLVDTWHRTSQDLTTEVVQLFHSTERVNPVYMMAFSGARGNLSQVRQLVGMRGLMADPRGQIVGFPILSNFREGLTITEYFVSCYGARKGVVDTAIRTADAGYLTRRLADVSHHFVVRTTNCGTHRTICLRDIKEGQKTILPLASRLVGRVLGEHIPQIAFRNQEITPDLASKLASQCASLQVRSPLSCSLRWGVCQLCYGWGLSEGRRVTLGEAVGIIAAQSIGEPGTQLTLRTFHTGGVFSGDLLNEIRAPYNGTIFFPNPLQGLLVRTPHGQIAFLTKVSGKMVIHYFVESSMCTEGARHQPCKESDVAEGKMHREMLQVHQPNCVEKNVTPILTPSVSKAVSQDIALSGVKPPLNKEGVRGEPYGTENSELDMGDGVKPPIQLSSAGASANTGDQVVHEVQQKENKEFSLQPSTVIFVRQKEQVTANQLLAEFSSSTLQPISDQIEVTQQVLSESAGQVWFKEIEYGNRKGPGSGSLGTHFSSQKLGGVWVLAGKPRSEIILNDRKGFFVNSPNLGCNVAKRRRGRENDSYRFLHQRCTTSHQSHVQQVVTVGNISPTLHVATPITPTLRSQNYLQQNSSEAYGAEKMHYVYVHPGCNSNGVAIPSLAKVTVGKPSATHQHVHNVYHDDHFLKYHYSLGYSQLLRFATFLFAEKRQINFLYLNSSDVCNRTYLKDYRQVTAGNVNQQSRKNTCWNIVGASTQPSFLEHLISPTSFSEKADASNQPPLNKSGKRQVEGGWRPRGEYKLQNQWRAQSANYFVESNHCTFGANKDVTRHQPCKSRVGTRLFESKIRQSSGVKPPLNKEGVTNKREDVSQFISPEVQKKDALHDVTSPAGANEKSLQSHHYTPLSNNTNAPLNFDISSVELCTSGALSPNTVYGWKIYKYSYQPTADIFITSGLCTFSGLRCQGAQQSDTKIGFNCSSTSAFALGEVTSWSVDRVPKTYSVTECISDAEEEVQEIDSRVTLASKIQRCTGFAISNPLHDVTSPVGANAKNELELGELGCTFYRGQTTLGPGNYTSIKSALKMQNLFLNKWRKKGIDKFSLLMDYPRRFLRASNQPFQTCISNDLSTTRIVSAKRTLFPSPEEVSATLGAEKIQIQPNAIKNSRFLLGGTEPMLQNPRAVIGPEKKADGEYAEIPVAWWLQKEWKAAPGMLLAEPFFSSREHSEGQVFWLSSSFIQQKKPTFTSALTPTKQRPSVSKADKSYISYVSTTWNQPSGPYTFGVKSGYPTGLYKKGPIIVEKVCSESLQNSEIGGPMHLRCKDKVNTPLLAKVYIEDVQPSATIQHVQRLFESKIRQSSGVKPPLNKENVTNDIVTRVDDGTDGDDGTDDDIRFADNSTDEMLQPVYNPVIKRLIQTLNITCRQYSATNRGIFSPLKQNSTFGSFAVLLNCAHIGCGKKRSTEIAEGKGCTVGAMQTNKADWLCGFGKPFTSLLQINNLLTLNLFWQPLSLANYPNKIVAKRWESNSTAPTTFTNCSLPGSMGFAEATQPVGLCTSFGSASEMQSTCASSTSSRREKTFVHIKGKTVPCLHQKYNKEVQVSAKRISKLRFVSISNKSKGQKNLKIVQKPIWLSIHISNNNLSFVTPCLVKQLRTEKILYQAFPNNPSLHLGARHSLKSNINNTQKRSRQIENKLEIIGKKKRVEKNDSSLDQHIVHTINLPIVSFPYLIPSVDHIHFDSVHINSKGCIAPTVQPLHFVHNRFSHFSVGFCNISSVDASEMQTSSTHKKSESQIHLMHLLASHQPIKGVGKPLRVADGKLQTANLLSSSDEMLQANGNPLKRSETEVHQISPKKVGGAPSAKKKWFLENSKKTSSYAFGSFFNKKADSIFGVKRTGGFFTCNRSERPCVSKKQVNGVQKRTYYHSKCGTPIQGELLPLIRQSFWEEKGDAQSAKPVCFSRGEPYGTEGSRLCIEDAKEWIKNVTRQGRASIQPQTKDGTTQDCYIKNLRISDIQFAVSLPIKIISNLQGRYTSAHLTLPKKNLVSFAPLTNKPKIDIRFLLHRVSPKDNSIRCKAKFLGLPISPSKLDSHRRTESFAFLIYPQSGYQSIGYLDPQSGDPLLAHAPLGAKEVHEISHTCCYRLMQRTVEYPVERSSFNRWVTTRRRKLQYSSFSCTSCTTSLINHFQGDINALPIRNKVWIAGASSHTQGEPLKKFTSFDGAIFLDWYAFPLGSQKSPSLFKSALDMVNRRALESIRAESIQDVADQLNANGRLARRAESMLQVHDICYTLTSACECTEGASTCTFYQGQSISQPESSMLIQKSTKFSDILINIGDAHTRFYPPNKQKKTGSFISDGPLSVLPSEMHLEPSANIEDVAEGSVPLIKVVSPDASIHFTGPSITTTLPFSCFCNRRERPQHQIPSKKSKVPFLSESDQITFITNDEILMSSYQKHTTRITIWQSKSEIFDPLPLELKSREHLRCNKEGGLIRGTMNPKGCIKSANIEDALCTPNGVKKRTSKRQTSIHFTRVKPTYTYLYPGQLVTYGEKIDQKIATTESGQVLYLDSQRATLRKAQTVLIYSQAILSVLSGEWIKKSTPLMALSYQKLVTGDIVQGLPKIEQFFEAPLLKDGTFWSDSLQAKLNLFFQEHRGKFPLAEAVRKSFSDIQRVLVEGVQRVYISQGVLIADKHLEVIVRQMTCKGRILYSGDTGFLRNELVALDKIESVNQVTYGQKALYHPQVRGITDASLESESFLSAASFQETTRVLSRDAVIGKTDLMRGLKERVIVGELIQAGTGLTNNSVYSFLLD